MLFVTVKWYVPYNQTDVANIASSEHPFPCVWDGDTHIVRLVLGGDTAYAYSQFILDTSWKHYRIFLGISVCIFPSH
jgi:hypothetical protein